MGVNQNEGHPDFISKVSFLISAYFLFSPVLLPNSLFYTVCNIVHTYVFCIQYIIETGIQTTETGVSPRGRKKQGRLRKRTDLSSSGYMRESTEDISGGRGEWGGSVIVGYSLLCADRNSIVPHEAVSLNNMSKTKTVFPIPGFLF